MSEHYALSFVWTKFSLIVSESVKLHLIYSVDKGHPIIDVDAFAMSGGS